ncbi:MAG TPA: UpxY family transcription antiterminator [Candidatus Aquilonibacter sp.]|nr:UpxY family transcription antiterminator [Candidatus Aquilonibacter sp.]
MALNQATPIDVEPVESAWYVVYTCAHHEKKVAAQLDRRSIEQFLPLYQAVHRWKDRRMRVELPLFPGYVFARLALPERLRVLQVPGVVRFLSFNGQVATVGDIEISAIRRGLGAGLRVEPHPFLTVGRLVRVNAGPLAGLTGRLVRRKRNYRLVISMDAIGRSIMSEVSFEDIEIPPLYGRRRKNEDAPPEVKTRRSESVRFPQGMAVT